ncbi:hypothetical protein VSVS12_02801 [Vibrio scophthalmi]|uniref:Uncharacterized protein n=3 Tax=Vibrio scophthalmi TaxID=45658 RepID=A0A1B1NS62_9VIBR|nr:response regulator [Vibrio scophthalmi]ANS86540.1 hypothetical protein VSVS12_02801 [Vibrio scophthalmi]ANU35677.1 hypothetical protein VSVS05_00544 [Vibrio scophthalmi]
MDYFRLSSLNVLVVDDSKLMLQYLKELLISIGFDSGKIKTVDRYKSGAKLLNQVFDLVICDYHLDDGYNGIELIELLRCNGVIRQHTICIMASGETSKVIVQRCISARIDDYMVKPFDMALVKARVLRSVSKIKITAGGVDINGHSSKKKRVQW